MEHSFNNKYVLQIWRLTIFLWPLLNVSVLLFIPNELEDFATIRGILVSFFILIFYSIPIFLITFLFHLSLKKHKLSISLVRIITCAVIIGLTAVQMAVSGIEFGNGPEDIILFFSFLLSIIISGTYFKVSKIQKPLLIT